MPVSIAGRTIKLPHCETLEAAIDKSFSLGWTLHCNPFIFLLCPVCRSPCVSLGQLLRHLAKWHFRSGEIGGIKLLAGGTLTRRAYERLFALFGGTNPRDI